MTSRGFAINEASIVGAYDVKGYPVLREIVLKRPIAYVEPLSGKVALDVHKQFPIEENDLIVRQVP